MTKAFIWDLDGTLFDSYPVIVDILAQICAEHEIDISRTEINRQVIRGSVSTFSAYLSKLTGIPALEFKAQYSAIAPTRADEIQIMPHAKEILDRLSDGGAENYVYTHRGITTEGILKRLGLYGYFKDVVTGLDGFPLKPSPDALLYLIDKHGLDRAETCYVGDRTIDMDSAKNAGISGILFKPENSYCEPNGSERYTVSDLNEIARFI